jgi:hypothetical protein
VDVLIVSTSDFGVKFVIVKEDKSNETVALSICESWLCGCKIKDDQQCNFAVEMCLGFLFDILLVRCYFNLLLDLSNV